MDKRERIERALSFDLPDRAPYVDSFQHTGLIHHYTDKVESKSWTTTDVIKLASKVADMVQGWGLGPSMSKGERSVDRHGITWETDQWYSNIVATGIDGLNPCEPHSHMDVDKVRESYPDIVLWGGVDNSFLLVEGTPEEVSKRVEYLKEFGRDGGMLIGSTGQIHPACKLENLITMIETAHGSDIV